MRARCQAPGCSRVVHGRGLCDTHYRRAARVEVGPIPTAPVLTDTCYASGCDNPTAHKGWCKLHYGRLRLGAGPAPDPTERDADGQKQCSRCREWKPMTKYGVARARPDGKTTDCKDCHRERHYLRTYGETAEAIEKRLLDQAGLCAICQAELGRPHVDHNHTTGQVRGLLCGDCNRAIGIMRDSPERLRAAADYLEYQNTYVQPLPTSSAGGRWSDGHAQPKE